MVEFQKVEAIQPENDPSPYYQRVEVVRVQGPLWFRLKGSSTAAGGKVVASTASPTPEPFHVDSWGNINTVGNILSTGFIQVRKNNPIYFDGPSQTSWFKYDSSRAYFATSKGLIPNSDNSLDLGANGTMWANVYFYKGRATNVLFCPTYANEIGAAAGGDLVLSVASTGNAVGIIDKEAGVNLFSASSAHLLTYTHFWPYTNNAIDLGASGTAFRNFYVSGSGTVADLRLCPTYTTEVGASGTLDLILTVETAGRNILFYDKGASQYMLAASTANIVPYTHITPASNAAFDLGNASYKFRNAYFSGNINIDGNVDGVDISSFKATYDAHDHSPGDPTQISHNNLTDVTSNQHHTRYTDSEAVSAVESEPVLDLISVNVAGNLNVTGDGYFGGKVTADGGFDPLWACDGILIIEPLEKTPENPKEGTIYYNKKTKCFYGWNGSEWIKLGG